MQACHMCADISSKANCRYVDRTKVDERGLADLHNQADHILCYWFALAITNSVSLDYLSKQSSLWRTRIVTGVSMISDAIIVLPTIAFCDVFPFTTGHRTESSLSHNTLLYHDLAWLGASTFLSLVALHRFSLLQSGQVNDRLCAMSGTLCSPK